MKTPIVLVALWAFVVTPTVADTVVLSGVPTVRAMSSWGESTFKTNLSDAERQKYGVVIVKRGDEYFWASRENTRLVYKSGAFHLFMARTGSGYIKVLDPIIDPEMSKTGFRYMEHVHQGFLTYTYWGTADRFNP